MNPKTISSRTDAGRTRCPKIHDRSVENTYVYSTCSPETIQINVTVGPINVQD